jgi:tetratricopeptide (TPR) repeat protein
MWQGGKLKELHLMCYRISGDVPEIYPLKPKAENFLRKGVIAMQESNFELAEQYYRMALDANGEHPSILYNLLVLKQIDGSVKDAEKKLKDIIKKFPEYTFARIQLATQYARQGDVEKAKKLVERFQNKKEWHFGEINTWFSYNIELAITEEKFDIARNNLEILSEISEDFDFEYWDDYILRMERGAKFAPVVEMAEMEKKLHSGKKKRSR